MSILRGGDGTVVTRLTVRGTVGDSLQARLRLTGLLATLRLRPAGLAPDAVLCVRRFRDPLPGRIGLWDTNRRLPERWERALGASLDGLVRRAARPALGAIAADAEAVVFADRSELLACLARDWCTGDLNTRWWWQGLVRGGEPANAVLHAWYASPEVVPAALARLAACGEARRFLLRITNGDCRTLLRAVTLAHALPGIQAALDAPSAAAPARPAASVQSLTAPTAPLAPPSAAGSIAPRDAPVLVVAAGAGVSDPPAPAPAPPWAAQVPEALGAGLGDDQLALLGIGLLLLRSPHILRSGAFARDFRTWRQRGPVPTGAGAWTTTRAEPPGEARAVAGREAEPTVREANTSPQDPDRPRSPGASMPEELPLPSRDVERSPPTFDLAPRSAPAPAPATDTGSAALERCSRRSDPTLDELPALFSAETVETELGGLFYLINVGLFLDLYGDFTNPTRPGLALSAWDFVALVGHHLLRRECESDPAWRLLARLAGRDASTPSGAGFDPPGEWSVPVGWLAAFHAPADCAWSADCGRLRVVHPEGFLVLDVPQRDFDPFAQLRDDLMKFGDVIRPVSPPVPSSLPASGPDPLDRWLGWLVPYVRARLRRALGAQTGANAAELLLVHPARVTVTASRVDVALSLAGLPMAIRLAGLDRDPGWVPAAGRSIGFHFT